MHMLMHKDQDAVLHHHTLPVACHVLEGESSAATLYGIEKKKYSSSASSSYSTYIDSP